MLTEWLQALSHVLFAALHLKSGHSFPRPLSAKEEAEMLRRYRDEGDQAARAKLIEHNLRLVAHIVKKYDAGSEQEDLISIGAIGLIKAVNTFDDKKGIRLATYASRCIENEILMYFRAGRKRERDISISEPIETDREGQPLSLLDTLADEGSLCEDVEKQIGGEHLRRYIVEELDPREREVIMRRYGLCGDAMTQREVAKKLGISRSYVSRIEKKALEKLRERFERGDA